jgi:ABC-2 type transport system ATP-binding protein
MSPVVETNDLSKWYGQVIGVNDVTLSIKPGIVGLLGPNGAGKSTLLKLMLGLLKPSKGTIKVLGESVWNNPELNQRLGYCPEHDAFYDNMTGFQFVSSMAWLSGYSRDEADEKALNALESVDLMENKDKLISAYSKGMRQRAKIAQALVHNPELFMLDEPLNGMDPIGRRKTIKLVKELGSAGKSIIVSSHILYEIEAMTSNVLLINNGRILAEGNVHEIRELIDEHPHNVYIHCDKPRLLASILVEYDYIASVKLGTTDGSLVVETLKPDDFYSRLPEIVLENNIKIENLHSPDDNLQAVFRYLVG